jgi:hypothetical protein
MNMSNDEPTKIDKQPDRQYEEHRYVESVYLRQENTTSTVREVLRDSWLSDAQALRLNCVSLACGVVEKPLFTKDDDGTPMVEESVLRIAARFEEWISDGDVNTVAP